MHDYTTCTLCSFIAIWALYSCSIFIAPHSCCYRAIRNRLAFVITNKCELFLYTLIWERDREPFDFEFVELPKRIIGHTTILVVIRLACCARCRYCDSCALPGWYRCWFRLLVGGITGQTPGIVMRCYHWDISRHQKIVFRITVLKSNLQ